MTEEDPLPVEGLLQEIEGAELRGLDRRLDGPLPRDHDDLGRARPRFYIREDLQAAPPGHLDVEEDQVETRGLADDLQSVLPVRGLEECVALVLEDHPEGLADVLFIVDDKDLGPALVLHAVPPRSDSITPRRARDRFHRPGPEGITGLAGLYPKL